MSKMLDLETQSLAIKSLVLSYRTQQNFRVKTEMACRNDKNLLCALGLRNVIEALFISLLHKRLSCKAYYFPTSQ